MNLRIGFGIDVHRLDSSHDLILGGVKIDSEFGTVGHSDADVLIHAIIDAILGALNIGDIGTHFPDTDPKYKNISSIELLKKTIQMMSQKSYKINNIDCTIVLESPKLNPYFNAIREKLGEVMKLEPDQISLKAKTNEKMGYLGRGEGIKTYCTVLLIK